MKLRQALSGGGELGVAQVEKLLVTLVEDLVKGRRWVGAGVRAVSVCEYEGAGWLRVGGWARGVKE